MRESSRDRSRWSGKRKAQGRQTEAAVEEEQYVSSQTELAHMSTSWAPLGQGGGAVIHSYRSVSPLVLQLRSHLAAAKIHGACGCDVDGGW